MSRKRLSQIERRTQIVDVAMRLFASKGFKGTTTRAISVAAGVSEAIIFRHFETKEDLYNAIIAHTIEMRSRLWESLEVRSTTAVDLSSIMRDYALSFIQINRNDPTFIRLMMYSSLEDHQFRAKFFATTRSSRQRRVRAALERSIEKGEIRPVDASLTTRLFFQSLLQYSVSSFISAATPPEKEADIAMVDSLVSIFLSGLQIKPETEFATPDPP